MLVTNIILLIALRITFLLLCLSNVTMKFITHLLFGLAIQHGDPSPPPSPPRTDFSFSTIQHSIFVIFGVSCVNLNLHCCVIVAYKPRLAATVPLTSGQPCNERDIVTANLRVDYIYRYLFTFSYVSNLLSNRCGRPVGFYFNSIYKLKENVGFCFRLPARLLTFIAARSYIWFVGMVIQFISPFISYHRIICFDLDNATRPLSWFPRGCAGSGGRY